MKLLDSSIWIAHLVEANITASTIIESDSLLFSSILTIFEVKKKLIREKFNEEKISLCVDFIKKRAIIINLDDDIIESAVKISIKNNLSTIDSLIYASALAIKGKFITADNDFRDLNNVEIIEK